MPYRVDRGTLKPPVRRADGSILVEGVITRSGVFEYMNPDGSIRREYRPPEEVFKADSVSSVALLPVTNDHPGELLTSANTRDHIVGMTGADPRQDADHLVASMVVFDSEAIADIEAGKQELSCGYQVAMDETPGITPDGERYDSVQRKISYNHVAIVKSGRAGDKARIRMDAAHMVVDSTETTTSSVPPPGKNMELSEALKRIEEITFEKAKEALRADQAERDLKDANSRTDVATAERDDARDDLEKVETARTDASAKRNGEINEAVKVRVFAAGVLPDPDEKGLGRFDSMTDREIKVACIETVKEIKLDSDKSDEYVNVRFDIAVEDHDGGETLDAARAAGRVAKMDTSVGSGLAAAKVANEARMANAHLPKGSN